MQKTQLAEAVADEVRLKPARLEVAMPWELPQGHKDVIAESIAGEAWLHRLGLEGLLTGVTSSDLRVFRASVERLAGMLRYARQDGTAEAEAVLIPAHTEAMAALRARVALAAAAGFMGGALVSLFVTLFV